MPRLLHLPLLLMLLCGIASGAESQSAVSSKGHQAVGYQYLLSLPEDYASAPEKRWPVLLFLHGSGERGSDVWQVAVHGPPKLLRRAVSQPISAGATPAAPIESPEARARREQAAATLRANFIVVSPQCPTGTRWDDAAVLALLDDVLAQHRVDLQRVYLTGLSMGGYGTWSLALAHPERFAAIVPICGGGQIVDPLVADSQKLAALRTLGIWVFHGAKDPTVPLAESQRMVDAMKKYGVTDVTFTVYPDAAHDSWTETYNNPELYAWLLRHARKPPAE